MFGREPTKADVFGRQLIDGKLLPESCGFRNSVEQIPELHGIAVDFGQTTCKKCNKSKSDAALIGGLPDDVALLCLARVPRRYHCVLRCVSRRWRDLLCSEEWRICRRKNSLEETWIYVTCQVNWSEYIFYVLGPDPTEKSWNIIGRIPFPHRGKSEVSVEAVGEKLYVLCGSDCWNPWNGDVYFYDASAHKWGVASPMPTSRIPFRSATLDDKIYVCNSVVDPRRANSSSWDIYDSNSNSWVTHEMFQSRKLHYLKLIPLAGKLLIISESSENGNCFYDPETGTKQEADGKMTSCLWCPTVVVDGEIYMLDSDAGLMKWEKERTEWVATDHRVPYSGLAAVGRNIYLIGQDMSMTVIDVDDPGKGERVVFSLSDGIKFQIDNCVVGCKTISTITI